MESRRREGNRSEGPAASQSQIGIGSPNVDFGRQPYDQTISRVDFFRRMPTGGSTAYLKPADTQD